MSTVLTYACMQISDLTPDRQELIVEGDPATMRKNLAGDCVVVKWYGPPPYFVEELGLSPKNQGDMVAYLNDPANGWTLPPEE